MKLKRWSQRILLGSAAIGLGLGLISCGQSNTIDYLYATSAKNNPGQINIYRVDSESGALLQIADSPFPTQQRNPVSIAADSAGQSLYVAFEDDNAIVQYGIGTDAKLYAQNTVNPSGTEPVSVTVQSYYGCPSGSTNTYCNLSNGNGTYLGSLLFVVETYQPNYTSLDPGPGALYVYSIASGGALSPTPVTQMVNGVAQAYYPVEVTPTAAAVSPDGSNVYVSEILNQAGTGSGCSAGNGGVEAFSISGTASNGMPTGQLTPVAGTPFCAGTTPSALAVDQFSKNLYVTDSTQNQVLQYRITGNGYLTPLPTSTVSAGTGPDSITVDPYNEYVYVSNYVGDTVSGYAIAQSTGALSALASGSIATNTQPGCIIVEPALARFVYTANNAGNSISGFVLNRNTGALSATQGTFYNTSGLSRCVAAVSHGNHPIIHVQDTSGAGS